MKFGIFDHLDRSHLPLAEQYEQRLRLIETYDAAGFHCYHLAEHHSTSLGMAPSPSVFLAAVAQRTKQLRFGPLVYPLPLYHPLRVAEEIAMLDHMSNGRLEIGFGRGASQFEIEYYGVDPAEAKPRYLEGLEIVLAAMKSERLTFEGRFHSFRDTPIELHPLQKPHPRLWYGAGHPEAGAWAAERGISIVTNSPAAQAKPIFDAYKKGRPAKGGATDALMGFCRHCVIAQSDAEAERIAARAYEIWQASFYRLWKLRGSKPNNATYPETFEGLQAAGFGIAGSAKTVAAFFAREAEVTGANYAVARFAFGDLSLDESKRTVEMFRQTVMPAVEAAAS